MTTIKINIYRDGATWYNARWIGEEYDGSDPLGVDDNASDDEAMAAAYRLPLTASGERVITRVRDIDTASGRF